MNGTWNVPTTLTSVGIVIEYIQRQDEHHKSKDFKTEFREFLERHRIDYDERYVWD